MLHGGDDESPERAADPALAAVLAICVTDDVDSARARAAAQFALYGELPSYRAMLDREAYAGPEDAAVIGDEATVLDRIADLRREGIDELSAYPFGGSAESLEPTRALLRRCFMYSRPVCSCLSCASLGIGGGWVTTYYHQM